MSRVVTHAGYGWNTTAAAARVDRLGACCSAQGLAQAHVPAEDAEVLFTVMAQGAETVLLLIIGQYMVLSLFIAIASAELFNQGSWQRVWAAKSDRDFGIGVRVLR